jgi:hypothetical protein
VRHKVQAAASVWCANGARGDNRPLRIEPELVKVTEHPPEGVSVSNEGCDILHDDISGSHCANDVRHPWPSPPLVSGPQLLADDAEGLAWEPPTDDVDGRSNSASPPLWSGLDIVMLWDLRPMMREYRAAERIELDLADRGHSGALQA